ncbi:MAG TPA: hypothetical protein VF642_04295 [Propionibacteriaceae bacterium]|jgi:hypothetical protein
MTTKAPADQAHLRPRRTASLVAASLAMLALLVLAPFFLSSGLMAPLWAVVVLMAVWLALFVLGCLWFRRRPWWTLPLPVVALLIWLGTMTAGEAWLGWTA